MRRLLIFGFILISYFAKAQSWTSDSYSRYSEVTFYKVEALYYQMDFSRVDVKLLQAAIFYVTNEERKKAKLKTFKYNSKIENVAAGHARDMVKYNFYSHTSQIRIKRTVQDRFHLEGLNPKFYGENICSTYGLQYENGRKVNPPYRAGEFTYAFTSKKEVIPPHTYISFAKEVIKLWMESPGHRQNILNPKFTTLGCGASIYFDKSFYNMPYLKVVQNFGSD